MKSSHLRELDEKTIEWILINLSEWLLAEGHLLIKGEKRRVSEYVLGINGPPLTPSQRHWLTQLENNPLRLYDITEVVPGEQMTLCDVLDLDAHLLWCANALARNRAGRDCA